MAIEMHNAYYGSGEETRALFNDLKIQSDDNFLEHLNKYNCLMLNMLEFLSSTRTLEEMFSRITRLAVKDVKEEFPNVILSDEKDIVQIIRETYQQTWC
ncbi:MAG: hypothetical protein FWG10_09155 [Eubacteriaceae bacterium]|nr:hypothetical protein [Eubacteriaceae bacterium]